MYLIKMNKMNLILKKPPKIGQWLLKRITRPDERFSVIGDFEEIYKEIAVERGILAAQHWYWSQIIKSFILVNIISFNWSTTMFKNYLKIALRNIKRQKGYSFINITGLAVGMACCILIMLWVQDELSFDRFHENVSSLYRVARETEQNNKVVYRATVPSLLGPALKNEIPEITRSTRLAFQEGRIIKYGDKRFTNDMVAYADPDFLEMFTFPLIKGNPQTALTEKFSVIITEKMSQKYYGADSPLGTNISIDRIDFAVTGIMKNLPLNSHIQFDFLLPFDARSDRIKKIVDSWRVSVYNTYVQLQDRPDFPAVNSKITDFLRNQDPYHQRKLGHLSLQPITRIHLFHDIEDYSKGHGDIKYVYLFSALALLILIIACINFMNLTSARSVDRAKEVGIRKVVGAQRNGLIKQFIGESVIFVFISFILGITFVGLSLPVFNTWLQKQLTLSVFDGGYVLPVLVSILIITGVIAGIYPALILSSYMPVKVLKGHFKKGKAGIQFRRILVIVQFVVSISLIISVLIIYNQLEYLRNKDLGFDKKDLIYSRMTGNIRKNYESIRNELLSEPSILSVSAGTSPTTMFNGISSVKWEGQETGIGVEIDGLPVYYGFFETLGMKIVQGRSFSREFPSDIQGGFIINEEVARLISTDSPVGKIFSFTSYDNQLKMVNHEGTIIGVIKDFHNMSLHDNARPVVMYLSDTELHELCVRINPEYPSEAIAFIKEVWNKYESRSPFEYHFLEDTVGGFYNNEQKLGTILNFFTILAIFISCLGLFGLAAFTAEQRTKEIGIRKVLGSSVSGIISLLSREYIILIIFSNIIAWPLAYIAMNTWLQNFAYRITIGLRLFILSGLLALIIAVLTIGYQAIKAAGANPVDSLKYE